MYAIAQLSCKILSLYILINSITGLSTIVLMSQGTPEILKLIFPSVVQALLGLLLWVFAGTLASLMIPINSKNEPVPKLEENKGQLIAFPVLGLFFIGTSLPKLVSTLIVVLSTSSRLQIPQAITTYRILVESIIQLLVGLSIFLGSKGLVGLLNNLRNAGLSKDKIE